MQSPTEPAYRGVAKVLVAEQDDSLRDFLQTRLEAEGYTVVTATGGEDALRAVGREMPDAIILDLVLPEMDGLAVCRRLRADPAGARVPILALSGEGAQIEELLDLELDVDDFMTRPYNIQELLARLKTLLRQTALSPPARMIRAGSIELDLDRYVVKVDGEAVRLTSKEFELLRSLMEAKGRVLRREVLLQKVWGYGRSADVDSRTIDVHVGRLRQKLGPDGAAILTVRNVGYRFDMSLVLFPGANGRSASS